MLTREHAIAEFEGRPARARPDRLTRKRHGHYTVYAEKMLAVYAHGAGRMRRDLHRAIERIFADEPECPPRRVQAFCKLLDDQSTYYAPAGETARLRLDVFSEAAQFHPLVQSADRLFENDEQHIKQRLAERHGRSWPELEQELYADVLEFQRLETFEGYESPQDLLSRYNVAQVQACLYRATRAVIEAGGDFKTILRYVKLAKLLHDIERRPRGRYRIILTGPASVLEETRRYGVNFARIIPPLLTCRDWSLRAWVKTPWNTSARMDLSDRDGLRSHLDAAPEFDSTVEENFARKWGGIREGWQLKREAAILHQGQTTFVPDFLFRHDDGTEAHLEIVGYWTPEYLAAKRKTLRRFGDHNVLLAVAERSLKKRGELPPNIIPYKKALKIGPVLTALERMRRAC